MTLFLITLIATLFLYWLYTYLLQQSKEPSGVVGTMMMKLWNNVYLPMTQWALSLIPPQDYFSILDVGMGNGQSTNYLNHIFPESQIYGIDISAKAVAEAQRQSNNSRITFEKQSIEKTTYQDNQFNLICAFQNHFHWEDLTACLMEINRILAVNGTLLLACEANKINYYLPQFQDNKDFSHYLNTIGFKLLATKEQKQWICYQIIAQ